MLFNSDRVREGEKEKRQHRQRKDGSKTGWTVRMEGNELIQVQLMINYHYPEYQSHR